MYVIYCQNKPKSEFIVAEYDTYFDVSQSLKFYLYYSMDYKHSFNNDSKFRSSYTNMYVSGPSFHFSGNPAGHPVQTDH